MIDIEKADELKSKYHKIMVLMPTYKSMPAVCASSLIVFMTQMCKFGFDIGLTTCDQTNICMARNHLAGSAVEEDNKRPIDVILWLDSDHTFSTNDFLELLHHYDYHHTKNNVDILSARYIIRDNENPRVCAFRVDKSNPEQDMFTAISPYNNKVTEVDSIGFGFVLMNPTVLQKMYEEYGLYMFEFERNSTDKFSGAMVGEDMSFCKKAQKIGYKIYFDNSVEVGHYGGVINSKFMFANLHKDILAKEAAKYVK